MTWSIRVATHEEASLLPPIELSASRRYLLIPDLAFIPDNDDMPTAAHQRLIAQGTDWIAVDARQEVVGFLAAEVVGRSLHILELAVRIDLHSRGIGRQLLGIAESFARERQLESLTLTTFAHVPWNAPWYLRLGFEICVDSERLAAHVRAETERGWPHRCAMRKGLNSSAPTY